MATLYTHQTQNVRKTWFLMTGFLGLCLLIRPELAALVMGIALFFVAACIFWYSCSIGQKAQLPVPSLELQASIDGAPTTPATEATVIVFTAAFLIGRRLANWRGSFQNSWHSGETKSHSVESFQSSWLSSCLGDFLGVLAATAMVMAIVAWALLVWS